jgi:hypothetical protein
VSGSGGATDGGADTPVDTGPDVPASTLGFFVTSTGNGDGDFGGLPGADTLCQTLAAAVGAGGRTWHAYLSTTGQNAVDARDRIGNGPWRNAADTEIAATVQALHQNGIPEADVLDENGALVPNNEHDIMTGTQVNGTADAQGRTCNDWTSANNADFGFVGHSNHVASSGDWNTAHQVRCDATSITNANGAARIYCFAVD